MNRPGLRKTNWQDDLAISALRDRHCDGIEFEWRKIVTNDPTAVDLVGLIQERADGTVGTTVVDREEARRLLGDEVSRFPALETAASDVWPQLPKGMAIWLIISTQRSGVRCVRFQVSLRLECGAAYPLRGDDRAAERAASKSGTRRRAG